MGSSTRNNVRSASALAACAGLVFVATQLEPRDAAASDDPFDNTGYQQHLGRTTIPVTVKRYDFSDSHPDFGIEADAGGGRYVNMMSTEVDADRRPGFQSTGYKVILDSMDAAGNRIAPLMPHVSSMPGDIAGQVDPATGGAATSESTMDQWFNATPGVNDWSSHTMNFEMQPNGSYVMEGSLDTLGAGTEYTSELEWGFVYEADRDSFLEIETDAEAWVYIDGKLVIDGGGVSDPGLPGGHFDVDVYKDVSNKPRKHTHEFDDEYDVTYLDIANDPNLYFDEIVGSYPNPLRVEFFNTHNGGSGTYTFEAGAGVETGNTEDGFDRVFNAADLTQFRVDFVYLATMRGTEPKNSKNDTVDRDDAITVRLTDDATGDFVYEVAAYHHIPKDGSSPLSGLIGSDLSRLPPPRLTQRIDLSRLGWLDDRNPYRIQVFYANRTGAASDIRIETNVRTVNVLTHVGHNGRD